MRAKRGEIDDDRPGDVVQRGGSGQSIDTPDLDSGNDSGIPSVPVVTSSPRPPYFATIDRATLNAISSRGGKNAHAKKNKSQRAHEYTSAEARRAGKKGGAAILAKYGRGFLAKIGKKGSEAMRNRVTVVTVERDA